MFIGALVTSIGVTANPVQAETGKGEDIFKVILTIFGVENPGRSGRPEASTCPGRDRRGTAPPRRSRRAPASPSSAAAVCGAPRSGESSGVHSPASTRSISPRIAIIASQNRSSSREVLALGRLHHQRAGDREAHRRCVEAVVDQPLGDVVDADAAGLGQPAQVEDALVRDPVVVAAVEHREVLARAARRRSWPRAPRPPSPG